MSSQSIVLSLIAVVIGVVASIYTLRFSLQSRLGSTASVIASILNTLEITLFNIVYSRIAVVLTDSENHRTDTQFEDALVSKLFVFQFVNSYASFFFIAFIASYLPKPSSAPESFKGQCGAEDCMLPLSINLVNLLLLDLSLGLPLTLSIVVFVFLQAIIFGSRLFVKNIMDMLIPLILSSLKFRRETKGIDTTTTKLVRPSPSPPAP